MAREMTTTRDRLLRAALDVVQASGVAGATSRQIAAAAGTNLQAITYHFGSKDELVAQALVQAVRSWVEPARQALDGVTGDPVGHLVNAVAQLHSSLGAAASLIPAYLEALALAPRNAQFRVQIGRCCENCAPTWPPPSRSCAQAATSPAGSNRTRWPR